MNESSSSNEIKVFNPDDYGILRKEVFDILDSNKAEDIVVLNLNPHIGYDLYFMIATALSNTHLKKLVTEIIIALKKKGIYAGYVPNETDYSSGWIALDYGELIVHVFTKDKRDYYKLEDLWKDSIVETF